jgi:XTP/dITP diphosphohydrolase
LKVKLQGFKESFNREFEMNNIKRSKDTKRQEKLAAFDRLLTIMDELRENCPWDMKQNMDSLRYLTIEEMYELSEAIVEKNPSDIKKELGDVMLHLVFYARIASENNDFDIADVLNAQCEKLISRHPHIYGDVQVSGEEEVKKNWEALKLKEGNRSILSGVPSALPALVKAVRIQEKARGAGFDWDKKEQVWEKVEEEMNEFHEEVKDTEGTLAGSRALCSFYRD